MSDKPIMIDLFTGMHGWAEGAVLEGWRVIGFDLEDMCGKFGLPRHEDVQLVLQDVLTLHGKQFRDADLIVASPPCQAYSYRAMPFKRARSLPPPDNTLFEACFRIQAEACEAAGRHIPLVVENVRGAQKWVGRARWNYGSYYLWGDVPALMPIAMRSGFKSHGMNWSDPTRRGQDFTRIAGPQAESGIKNEGGSWFWVSHNKVGHSRGDRIAHTPHMTSPDEPRLRDEAGIKLSASGRDWFDLGPARHSSKSPARKFASAMIAKIPLPLSRHIAWAWRPERAKA